MPGLDQPIQRRSGLMPEWSSTRGIAERGGVTTATASIDTYTATCDGRIATIVHRDGEDVVLLDTLLTGPIRDERELADLLRDYVAERL
jgi:hypothetical protein